jgi:hypothetical protein
MRIKNIVKGVFVYVFAILAMTFAGWQLREASVSAQEGEGEGCPSSCCNYGIDCSSKCCLPGSGEANCSQTCPNYCRAECG